MKRPEPAVHLMGMDATANAAMTEAATMLAAVRERDQAAFTHLVAGFDHELLRLAYVIAGSRPVAEDAAQATWERLWHKPPDLREPSKLRSWLLTVCANEARQAGRRRRRGAELDASAAAAATSSNVVNPDLADLHVALGRLSTGDRELLALRFAVGLASSEIAEHLGISAEGARSRLHRLLNRLREGQRDDSGSIGDYLLLVRGDGFSLVCPYFREGDPLAPTVCD